MARFAFGSTLAPLVVGACLAASTQTTRAAAQTVHPHDNADETFESSTIAERFTRTAERAPIEARGAARIDARIDSATLQAAAVLDNQAWGLEQRRELLAYLRGSLLQKNAQFTEADARIVAQLQAGSGGRTDGVVGDETMAILFALGFRSLARKAMPWEVKLEFYPGELENRDAWAREIEEEITWKRGSYRDVDAPPGEGTIYVRVGRSIVASYRARGGPPFPIDDGDHVAVPTTPGAYRLAAGRLHVTSNWRRSQIPWGAEIREVEGGYQYRSAGGTWSWATRHPATRLKEAIGADEFASLPEVTRNGVTYFLWNKNDFGPLAWNLVRSDLYVHTTPDAETEAKEAEAGGDTDVGVSHGCIHIDPRDRDEMVKLGYLARDISFVVRRWDEHLLPDELRREIILPKAAEL